MLQVGISKLDKDFFLTLVFESLRTGLFSFVCLNLWVMTGHWPSSGDQKLHIFIKHCISPSCYHLKLPLPGQTPASFMSTHNSHLYTYFSNRHNFIRDLLELQRPYFSNEQDSSQQDSSLEKYFTTKTNKPSRADCLSASPKRKIILFKVGLIPPLFPQFGVK